MRSTTTTPPGTRSADDRPHDGSRRSAAREPAVPRPVARAAAALFGGLSKVRGSRVFHPKGVGYSTVLSVAEPHPEYRGVPLLSRSAEHPALARFSYAAGLPDSWPDALGLALRLTDVHGPGRHQDFLLITSGSGLLTQHLILPGPRGFRGHWYSSLLPYRVGGRIRMVGARPARPRSHARRSALPDLVETCRRGDVLFELCLGTLSAQWQTVAELRIGDRLDDALVERLAFNPWHTGGGIRPAGPLMGLRRPSYEGSQRGRGVDPDLR